ncbi:class II aldolase and adducin N-terminal domain-containing protein [Helicobacter suis]|uniref:L-fuculose-1-phosphate aldolase FucA n=1 Tax=Helicobacter suis TaxID=104628 RepID=A0A6J4CZP9_9HELI|nr:class II aldolase and adducin N-terminal domain-containing protein [Helicobacter suis]BCD46340.1 L-fuculose-1-phosphate aldolase FucA [Helicobacter suis]BCD47747.1 L-fuculose-1-phosphate aldolase FucA [Helicobacter suis]BCD49505.1 L-fuculose-1-phosphate aldolase FucA [Helicobacter suis]BCD51541.1 L-fuculose-1-phosphate aldolase FucA [Helicobacter suis]BCD70675.1 L-fuculose-1-phosphate aldolase FucA [Helicobacter suis]
MNIYVREVDQKLLEQLQKVSLSMFRKGFFSIFRGSISARMGATRFIINKNNAVFDNLDEESFIVLHDKLDYRWQESSMDTSIHASIYQYFTEARFIAYARPPHAIAYSLNHDHLIPKDYLGCSLLGQEIEIYDPKNYKDWKDRSSTDILHYLQTSKRHFIFIRGCGIVVYHRELQGLLKIFDLIEGSCQILQLASSKE